MGEQPGVSPDPAAGEPGRGRRSHIQTQAAPESHLPSARASPYKPVCHYRSVTVQATKPHLICCRAAWWLQKPRTGGFRQHKLILSKPWSLESEILVGSMAGPSRGLSWACGWVSPSCILMRLSLCVILGLDRRCLFDRV